MTVVADENGLAVIGSSTVLDKFFDANGLVARELKLGRLDQAMGTGAATAQAATTLMENSGRWVKLTKESARAFHAEELMKGSTKHVSRAITMKDGKISGILEIATGPGAALLGPAGLPILAGMMA